MGNICNRLSHSYAPTYKVQTSLILCRKDCSLRKGISAKFPGGGGGKCITIWPTVYMLLIYEKFCVGPWVVRYVNKHLKFQK